MGSLLDVCITLWPGCIVEKNRHTVAMNNWSWRTSIRPRARLLVMVALGLLLLQQALLWWIYYHAGAKQLAGDEVQYLAAARAVLAGGPWHPSHIWPPGQSLLIASMQVLFGSAIMPIQLVQTILFLGCGGLLWRLWRRLGGSRLAAAFAAALFLLNPSDAAYAHYLWPEIPHLFCMLLTLNLLLRDPQKSTVARPHLALLAGLSLGLALIFKSLLAVFWPLLMLCFFESWRPLRLQWKSVAAFLLGVLLITAPALIAGHRNTGHWSIADSSVFNLVAGLSDRARNDYVDEPVGNLFGQYLNSGTTADQRNAWAYQQLQQRLQDTPPLELIEQQFSRQYFRLFESKTLLLTQLPGPACAGYMGAYHDTPPGAIFVLRWSSHLLHTLILVGFAFGLCLWREWRTLWLWLLLTSVGYQLALYSGLHVKARFLLPMIPLFCCFAGEVYARIFQRDTRLVITPMRLLAASLLAMTLLFLAFAGPWIDGYCRS